ncbi:UNVERIFIED_CONTAM: hypothetical protein Cloal_2733 [Acetivibrio alkalicellulosi]
MFAKSKKNTERNANVFLWTIVIIFLLLPILKSFGAICL